MENPDHCPFCGSFGVCTDYDNDRRSLVQMRCVTCGATGGKACSVIEAMKRWNMRVGKLPVIDKKNNPPDILEEICRQTQRNFLADLEERVRKNAETEKTSFDRIRANFDKTMKNNSLMENLQKRQNSPKNN
jgi:hypothetical protein